MLYRYTSICLLSALLPLGANAAAGGPLPRCSADSQSFYLMRYTEVGTSATNLRTPTTSLDMAAVPTSGAVTLTNVWNAQSAPTPSQWDGSPTTGATVAGGMGKDGYIYAMRAVGTWEPGWTKPGTWGPPDNNWQTHTRYYEMLRFGRSGVDNLGIVSGLGTYRDDSNITINGAVDLRLGPNFNAADIDPVTGIMYLAAFQSGGPLNKLFKIDVTQTPPQYVGTLTLSTNIPGAQSGDFAIDAAGQYAYGVAKSAGTFGNSSSYRINLATGTVETLASSLGIFPFGAAARLPNNNAKLAFYGISTQIMTLPGGTLGASQSTPSSTSADGAACLPKLKATLQCVPAALVDADNNIATCTVTLDQPAPTGGITVALTPPASNPRYTTTCASPITIAANASTAQCTITATSNTVPGDGDVTAAVALAPPAATDDYELGAPSSANVLIQNDDLPTVTLSCTPGVLTDSANQVSTCTVTSNAPASVGGMTIALTPPPANPRYSSTCGATISLAQGASSNTCTITAAPNTTPGDGDVPAPMDLTAPQAGSGYQIGAPSQASVLIKDDDSLIGPAATVACTPTTLVDSANQTSTCTFSLSIPAPAGGVSINIAPPANNSRYSATCASPLVIPAGTSIATCTITATPNTVADDGSVTAVVQLLAGSGYELGSQTQAKVTVNDDDQTVAATPVPTLGQWAMIGLSILIALIGFAATRRQTTA